MKYKFTFSTAAPKNRMISMNMKQHYDVTRMYNAGFICEQNCEELS
jgi:hypothetical protein